MKELTIEEKAKRYDEALERAKEKYAMFEGMKQGDVLEDVFPELKESEDERIRKELIEFVKSRGGFKQEYIAWLEKQGEQKHVEWSEEDESWFKELELMALSFSNDDSYRKKFFAWLNSLKDRYTWKPTEEQMKALSNALSLAKNCGEESAFDLSTLYEQLKRL